MEHTNVEKVQAILRLTNDGANLCEADRRTTEYAATGAQLSGFTQTMFDNLYRKVTEGTYKP